jgi:hypothetical protein
MTWVNNLFVVMFAMTVGYIVWYKNRSIIIPAIMAMVFMTVVGVDIASMFAWVGPILGGAVAIAMIIMIIKIFW